MHIQQDYTTATYEINDYQPRKLIINQQVYTDSIIIQPHQLWSPWRPRHIFELQIEDFDCIPQCPSSILILGTGLTLQVPPRAILHALFEKGFGVEWMNNKAACYTYTILANENRAVTACLLGFD